MVYDRARQRTILFGGFDGAYRGDTWAWDGIAWAELAPAASPPPRANHAMAYDSVRRRVVVFGGFDGGWSLSEPYVVTLARGSGAVTYRIDSRRTLR